MDDKINTILKWCAGAVAVLAVVAFVGRDGLAEFFGYAAVVTEKVKGDGAAETVKTISTSSPAGRFLRDLIIALAAFAVIVIAALRSYALFIQSKVATDNLKLAADNFKLSADNLRLSEKRLLDERFSAAAELMAKANKDGKPAISACISGMHIMETLAKSAPKEFAEQVVKNLIAYIKVHIQLTAIPSLKDGETPTKVRMLGEDVKVAFATLHNILDNKAIKAEIGDAINADLDFSFQNFSWLDLNDEQIELNRHKMWGETNFESSILANANFNKAHLWRAKLIDANLDDAVLTETDLCYADMTGASLRGADMRRIITYQTTMINADLRGAKYNMEDLAGADLTGAKMNDD